MSTAIPMLLVAWFKIGGFAVTQASGTAPRMNAGIQQRVTQLLTTPPKPHLV